MAVCVLVGVISDIGYMNDTVIRDFNGCRREYGDSGSVRWIHYVCSRWSDGRFDQVK